MCVCVCACMCVCVCMCVRAQKHGRSVDARVQRHLETRPVASERGPAAEYMPGLVGRQRCESSLEVPA